MGRNPRHPEREIAGFRERKSLGVPEAAVIAEWAPVTLGLAKRLEAAG